jgi:hypothetical protein
MGSSRTIPLGCLVDRFATFSVAAAREDFQHERFSQTKSSRFVRSLSAPGHLLLTSRSKPTRRRHESFSSKKHSSAVLLFSRSLLPTVTSPRFRKAVPDGENLTIIMVPAGYVEDHTSGLSTRNYESRRIVVKHRLRHNITLAEARDGSPSSGRASALD